MPLPLDEFLGALYRTYGPPKTMGESAPVSDRPHFFLHRNFLGEQDLAILFNTKRCRYQCKFCALPFKSSREWVPAEQVRAQFHYVLEQDKHALGVLERITIANEGSVFDETTFPAEALAEITAAVRKLPRVRKIVLESRLEFVTSERLRQITESSGKQLDILTGFETLDEDLRERVLGKREPLESFLRGLDVVAEAGCELTTYVLFKPDPEMTDGQAWAEAEASIDYLHEHCASRGVPLTIRLNPMYVAHGTQWARHVEKMANYQPPKLSDIVALAERKRSQGIAVYLGLTSEGLSDEDKTYRAREDFTRGLLKHAIVMNSDGTMNSEHHRLPLVTDPGYIRLPHAINDEIVAGERYGDFIRSATDPGELSEGAMEQAWRRGRSLLDTLRPVDDRMTALVARLVETEGLTGQEDGFAWLCCVLALVSANEGNYGVGAMIVRDDGIVAEGRNRLLRPHWNTSSHAEANALDVFESAYPAPEARVGAVMYTSLECCPMCTVRLLNSGIRTVRYLAPDENGGMLTRMEGLPPYWRGLAAGRTPRQTFEPASCDPLLRGIAADVFAATEAQLNERLVRS